MDDVRTLRRDLNRVVAALRQLGANIDQAASQTPVRVIQRGAVSIGGLGVGNVDVTLTWPQPWPDASYGVYPAIISGTGALGALDVTLKAGTKTASDCVLTVANTGTGPVGTFAVDVLGVRA